MPPTPPPPLVDDVIAEILLRLPPDEPEHLIRAALVCKPWLRVICDPGFRRSYRDFHGAPPLLGFLHRLMVLQGDPPACFASTTSVPEFPHPGSDALDCRHGRVLVHMFPGFLVWDPVTGDRHCLPPEPKEIDWLVYSAVVLCAAEGCDHLDCRGGPFRVVFAATHEYKDIILASVYSSEKKLQNGYSTGPSSWRKQYLLVLPIPMTSHSWSALQRVWVSSSLAQV